MFYLAFLPWDLLSVQLNCKQIILQNRKQFYYQAMLNIQHLALDIFDYKNNESCVALIQYANLHTKQLLVVTCGVHKNGLLWGSTIKISYPCWQTVSLKDVQSCHPSMCCSRKISIPSTQGFLQGWGEGFTPSHTSGSFSLASYLP